MSKIKGKPFKKAKNPKRVKSRKEIRKENRKLKKQKRLEYYTNRKKEVSPPEKKAGNKIVQKEKTIMKNDRFKEIQNEKLREVKLKKEMVKRRSEQLHEANIEEDKNIKRLEKQLKLNKRKSKAIPKSFISDGLDYLLEVCDGKDKSAISTEQQFNEANEDFEEDFELMTRKVTKKQKIEEELDLEDSDEESEDAFDEGDLEDSDKESEDSNCDLERENEEIIKNSNDVWEDIYGRLRNQDGSVVTKMEENKYVPPALRGDDRLNRLNRQLKGLLNRLAEANMHGISTQVEDLYMNNSRNDMNDTITNLMMESLATNILSPERLLLEHVMLITILHANIGTEIGAHFLQEIVRRFNNLFDASQEVEDKTLDNVVNLIAQLYNFKVIDAQLIYDILSKLSKKFDEKSVECILLILKNVGFNLRKDDPLALKALILDLQKRAANATEETNSRVKFMLDILLAIKNNNVSKIPNYDTNYSEHLKKLLKSFIRKGNYVTQLKISLDDLLKAESHGKWWIVGSAWSGNIEANPTRKDVKKSDGFSQKLLDLAKKHHMNTDTRRSIFCVIMSAEDYLDAFEKLLRLGLKNQQEREIVNVIIHCCLQERDFNPYYAVLAQKFCDYDRKFQLTIKYSVWDKLKALTECSATQLSNLAKLLTHLFLEKGLPISTLKIVEFCEMDKVTLRFLRQVLLGILLTEDGDVCTQVFEKVSHSDKLKMFRESLRLFIHHFVLKNLNNNAISEKHKSLLQKRSDAVEKLLITNEKKLRL